MCPNQHSVTEHTLAKAARMNLRWPMDHVTSPFVMKPCHLQPPSSAIDGISVRFVKSVPLTFQRVSLPSLPRDKVPGCAFPTKPTDTLCVPIAPLLAAKQ